MYMRNTSEYTTIVYHSKPRRQADSMKTGGKKMFNGMIPSQVLEAYIHLSIHLCR
jgi:hypothetical protein